ncbi:hypothetical protein HMPREF9996_02324 [Aggregatibacter actinomycetemcomitans Y4]|nr:hypothetical protein HMPREF9996_02324 [Aggregatibacter actinomycetemcomitans Y4]
MQFAVAGQYQIIFGCGTMNKVHAELIKWPGMLLSLFSSVFPRPFKC